MKNNKYEGFTRAIKKILFGVLICTMGVMFYWPGIAVAASAGNKKIQKVVPPPTQTPGKTAPSHKPAPPLPTIIRQKRDFSKLRKDLSVSCFTTSKYSLETGESVRLSFRANNLGDTIIGRVPFSISLKWGGCHLKLADGYINNLARGGFQSKELRTEIPYGTFLELALCGSRDPISASLEVFIDPLNTISEENEENNKAQISNITYRQKRADLTITKWHVRGRPARSPQWGESFVVVYEVKNIGDYPSPRVGCVIDKQVWYSSDRTDFYGTLISIPPLSPNETHSGSFTYSIVEGISELLLVIMVDRASTVTRTANPYPNVGEWEEFNNTAHIRFFPYNGSWDSQGI